MPALNPQILGRAENAHRALLDRVLDGSGLTYEQWVALNLAQAGATRGELVERLAGALKLDNAGALRSITELTAAPLLETDADDRLQLTEAGRDLHGRVRAAVGEVVGRLYAGIPDGDLATAGRVLVEITERADAELAR